ncbi:MAG: hypothetical protein ACK4M9_04395 [Anaerobacillus sp.]|uniref:hypothetical protein n=1 Tax=Anaerobacillus sp. TaxID=1872506 RepID=UPI00391894EF
MKQWLILSVVIFLFLLVWGSLVYLIVFKQESPQRYAHNLAEVSINVNMKKVRKENEHVVEEVLLQGYTREQTELNKLKNPPLKLGIDYGQGISVDDLLRSIEIDVNN